MADDRLGTKAIRGSLWVVSLEVSNQALQFVKTFYAAHILTPQDFGVVGFSFLIITFIDVISTTGMKEAIIQRNDDLTSYLSTVWLVEVFKGTVVLVLAIGLAPWLPTWMHSPTPELTSNVIRLIGIIYFIQCLTNIGVVYFEKDVQFKRYFIYQFSGTVADVAVTLAGVYLFKNVWALFYGILAGYVTRVIFSFLLIKFKPSFEFSLPKAKELLRFGKWIFRSRIFTFLGMQLDSIVISSFLGLFALGIYQMAFRIGNLPMTQIANVMGKVMFPMFARVQDENAKLKEYFLVSLNLLAVTLSPLIVLVYCFIPEFTDLFLGSRWHDIVIVVRVLLIAGFVRIVATVLDYYFSATGTPRLSSAMQFYRALSFMIVVGPLAYGWGVEGVAFSGLAGVFVVTVFYLPKACSAMGISRGDLSRNLFESVAYATVWIVALLWLKSYFVVDGIVPFFLVVSAVSLCYLGIGLGIARVTRINIFGRAIDVVKSFRRNG